VPLIEDGIAGEDIKSISKPSSCGSRAEITLGALEERSLTQFIEITTVPIVDFALQIRAGAVSSENSSA
jgi:hypothetical protein